MKNFYDSFHNLFKVSKTLRFELIPIGKTNEYFAERIRKADEKKSIIYKKIRPSQHLSI